MYKCPSFEDHNPLVQDTPSNAVAVPFDVVGKVRVEDEEMYVEESVVLDG